MFSDELHRGHFTPRASIPFRFMLSLGSYQQAHQRLDTLNDRPYRFTVARGTRAIPAPGAATTGGTEPQSGGQREICSRCTHSRPVGNGRLSQAHRTKHRVQAERASIDTLHAANPIENFTQ